MVGETETGRTRDFNVIYPLMRIMASGYVTRFPADPRARIHLAPLDFVVGAIMSSLDAAWTVGLTFQTTPGGLQLTVDSTTAAATFTRTVIVGSSNSTSAPSPQPKGRQNYTFSSWSDGGAQSHTITAPAAATTYTARFNKR